MTDPLKALFGKPDYSHIVRDTTATISITAAEMAAVLEAYDRGIDTLAVVTATKDTASRHADAQGGQNDP